MKTKEMDFSNGLKQLKVRTEQYLQQEVVNLNNAFGQVQTHISHYMQSLTGTSRPFASMFGGNASPSQSDSNDDPEGFFCGTALIPAMKPGERISFPLLYSFPKENATAIEEHSECAHFLFNFALRSMISYPLGNSIVYLLDSNISGDFNMLSPLSTPLDDNVSAHSQFHYVTNYEDQMRLLTELGQVVDHNILSYVSRYPSLMDYNRHNSSMREPYRFVFIRDIVGVYSDRQQIERLAKLVASGNAAKAGVYLFFTYDKQKLDSPDNSYFADAYSALRYLLSLSCVLEQSLRVFLSGEQRLEPKANYEIVDQVIKYVRKQKPPVTLMSFKDEIDQKLVAGRLWQPSFHSEDDHLYFPVGFQNAVTKKELDIAFNNSPHLMVGGETGSGKSILLQNIILNGALRYSPEQLRYYLVDMKGGVSFASYRNLPHVAALSASASRHYAASLLDIFRQEILKRTALFKREHVTGLSGYNARMVASGQAPLPYLFCIIDEFQELVKKSDSLANQALEYIAFILDKGRSQGVFIALCAQDPPGNVSYKQVGVRLTMTCDENTSVKIIGNGGAAKLHVKGRAILNTSKTGEEKYNEEFQVAFIDEEKDLPAYIKRIQEIYLQQHQGNDPLTRLVYDDNDREVRLSDCDGLIHPSQRTDTLTPYLYIGQPGFYRKEHVKFCFHRDANSNVLIVGGDRPTALRLAGLVAIQFLKAYQQRGAQVYMADTQKQLEPTFGKLSFLSHHDEVTHTDVHGLQPMLTEVYQLLCDRRQHAADSVNQPEVLFALLDVRPDTTLLGNGNTAGSQDFDFGLDEPVQKPSVAPIDMLQELLVQGPDLGIHMLIYHYNYANMSAVLNDYRSLQNRFEVQIAVRGGESYKLFSAYNLPTPVDKPGEAFIRMPEEMGLKYVGGDCAGDPFLVYNTMGKVQSKNTDWQTLFTNLPNKKD